MHIQQKDRKRKKKGRRVRNQCRVYIVAARSGYHMLENRS